MKIETQSVVQATTRAMFHANVEIDELFDSAALGVSNVGDVLHMCVDRVLHSDWDSSVRLVHVSDRGAFVAKECLALDADAERSLMQLYRALPASTLLVRPVATFRSTSATRVLLFRFEPHTPWHHWRALPLSVRSASLWSIAVQLMSALVELHAVSIVHRNVTLGNVLFNAESGCLRLIDFDDAIVMPSDPSALVDVVGNGHFMPPEDEQSDAAMDVFAAGVCLAALCLNKELLFEFDERDAAMQALRDRNENDRRSLAQFWNHDHPSEPAFEAIVWQMLAYDRKKRITALEAHRQFAAGARAAPM